MFATSSVLWNTKNYFQNSQGVTELACATIESRTGREMKIERIVVCFEALVIFEL